MPEGLNPVWIEFATGWRVEPRCSEDAIVMALPAGSEPPMKPGCGGGPTDSLVERAGRWLREIIR